MTWRRRIFVGLGVIAALVVAAGAALAYVVSHMHWTETPGRATLRGLRAVQLGVIGYQTDNPDACPKSLDELYAQKYITHAPRDEWGEPFLFTCPSTHATRAHKDDPADIVSKGKDGLLGTLDDYNSWEH